MSSSDKMPPASRDLLARPFQSHGPNSDHESAASSRVVNRLAVRELAQRHWDELVATAKAGGNPNQRSLDQQDEIAGFVQAMNTDEAVRFHSIYAEELGAITEHSNRQGAAALEQATAGLSEAREALSAAKVDAFKALAQLVIAIVFFVAVLWGGVSWLRFLFA